MSPVPDVPRRRLSRALILVAAVAALASCRARGDEDAAPSVRSERDWSGVARSGDRIILVENRSPGGYFELVVDEPSPRVLPITAAWVPWPNQGRETDLESVDVLADGRVVALSEDRRTLVAKEGVLATYPKSLSERGNRGLEGLAVRESDEGRSVVAVLHEGGFPVGGSRGEPAPPRLLVHGLGSGSDVASAPIVNLDVERPADGQRFRAPDLVWHRLPADEGGTRPYGFIVLLSSGDRFDREFRYVRLQRFTTSGRRIGEPMDLRACEQIPAALREASTNWEGLGWWEPGRTLMLCFDTHPRGQRPVVLTVDIPASWR